MPCEDRTKTHPNSRLKSTESREKKGIGSSKMKGGKKTKKGKGSMIQPCKGKDACWTHLTTELCPWERMKKKSLV